MRQNFFLRTIGPSVFFVQQYSPVNQILRPLER